MWFKPSTWPFWGVHLAAAVGIWQLGWSWSGVLLAMTGYYIRMFFVTAGYHRYFSHRAYKTSRWFQFLLGFGATLTVQKGPVWWAGNHRHHHKASDRDDDIHSPRHGFWWSHLGWFLVPDFDTAHSHLTKDFEKYPELHFLGRHYKLITVAFATSMWFIGSWHLLVWGFFVPTMLAWHGTFTINSLSHVFGNVRYDTGDDSKNNFLLAILTMGEGWHNNHHHYQRAANQGWLWYQFDPTYYILVMLSWLGLVRDVQRAPAHIVEDRPKERPTAPPKPQPAISRSQFDKAA